MGLELSFRDAAAQLGHALSNRKVRAPSAECKDILTDLIDWDQESKSWRYSEHSFDHY